MATSMAAASPPESQTAHDQQSPLQVIAARVSGVLRGKLQGCVVAIPTALMDMGLMDWDEFKHYGYESQAIERTSLLFYEDVNGAIDSMKKPPSEHRLSHSQADMLAKAARAVARGHLGMPEAPRSPAASLGRNESSQVSRTESQLSHDTAKLTALSHLKCGEKLDTVNGLSRPAHVYDVMVFMDEVSKTLVAMEGYDCLVSQMEMLKADPTLSHADFAAGVSDDIWRQQARLAYTGIPSQYKRDVLSKSKYAKVLFDPGILAYAMYATAVDISDRETTRKKLQYQEVGSVRPNDKQSLDRAFRTFDRSSFELLQLQELGSARSSPQRMQYNAGMVLFSNYSDISQEWSRMWKEGSSSPNPGSGGVSGNPGSGGVSATQDARHMTHMMQEIYDAIQKLPELRPYRVTEFAPVSSPAATPDLHRNICRQFSRTGSCSYGDKCKFSHKQGIVNMNMVQETDEQVIQLQNTMNEVYNVTVDTDGANPISKDNFVLTYDTAYSTVGTENFEETSNYLAMMVSEERSELDDRGSNDGWHL